MYVPRQTLSIELKKKFEEQFWNKALYFLSFSVPSVTHPYTSDIYLGVTLLNYMYSHN